MTTQTEGTMEELIVKAEGGTSFPPHPDGQHPAICIDIIDRGMVETEYKGEKKEKHKITLRFFCGQWTATHDDNGNEVQKPLWVDAWFTASLHEKSALRPFLENWRGRAFTDEELAGFNVAKLLHVPAYLQLKHNKTPDRTYCNIGSIMALPKGMDAPQIPTDYVRVKDRPPQEEENDGGFGGGSPFDDKDDLPFS